MWPVCGTCTCTRVARVMAGGVGTNEKRKLHVLLVGAAQPRTSLEPAPRAQLAQKRAVKRLSTDSGLNASFKGGCHVSAVTTVRYMYAIGCRDSVGWPLRGSIVMRVVGSTGNSALCRRRRWPAPESDEYGGVSLSLSLCCCEGRSILTIGARHGHQVCACRAAWIWRDSSPCSNGRDTRRPERRQRLPPPVA